MAVWGGHAVDKLQAPHATRGFPPADHSHGSRTCCTAAGRRAPSGGGQACRQGLNSMLVQHQSRPQREVDGAIARSETALDWAPTQQTTKKWSAIGGMARVSPNENWAHL